MAFETKRLTVPAMEAILYKKYDVLDKGFVCCLDYMGGDKAIVDAARVSYASGTKHVSTDEGLINYLQRCGHSSPAEMCEIKFAIKLPIFVARQWLRHRTSSVNEVSARYSILDDDYYLPSTQDVNVQSKDNKQGRGTPLNDEDASNVVRAIAQHSADSHLIYKELLSETNVHPPVARELARTVLPVNYYTTIVWKIDLHNLFHFLKLRMDPHAQLEIRKYAEVIAGIVQRWVPMAYAAFKQYKLDAVTLSPLALNVIKRMSRGEDVKREDVNMSASEWKELMKLIE